MVATRFSRRDLQTAFQWFAADRGPLKQQVTRGWIWVFLGEGVGRFIGLIKLSVLGHLLSPTDYGVFGVAALLMQWLSYFTQSGLDSALIQRKGGIRSYLDVYWTSQVVRGVALAAILVLGAPLGAAFFHAPEAAPVIRLFGIGACIYGLRNPGVVYLRKDLYFRKDTVWRSAGSVVGLFVAVPLALLYRSVWALAFSAVAADIAEVAASYWIHPYRPRICLSWSRLKDLTGFSKWIVVSNSLGFLEQYMDSVAVGKFLGARPLGVYQVSGQIALLPTAQIGAQMRAVLFPAFSKIEDVPRLRRAFLDAFGVFFLLALPAASFLAVFAQLVVGIMLGPKWADASPFLRVLVWAGVMKGFAALAAALSLAVGRPRIAVTASLVNIGLFAVLAYPLMSGLGLRGAALLIVLSSAATVVYYVSAVRPMLQLKLRDLVRCCRPAILAALPCVAAAPLVGSTVDGKTFAVAFCAAVSSALLILAALRRHFPARSPAIREAGAGADA